jgi:hypothetical protein
MDNSIRRKEDKVKNTIEKNKVSLDVYCIALASNQKNLFDIMNVNELMFKHYRESEICIVGLARGKDSAIRLVKDIIEDVYRETESFDVRSYFVFEG